MQIGAITGYIDVAQLTLYAFWIFFAGVVFYCRREDKREGYPLVSGRLNNRVVVEGFPFTPAPKVFLLGHGGMHETREAERPVAALPTAPWFGAPLEPTGNPMVDGVGPASWAMRTEDPNPIGMPVICADGRKGGTVVDVWVDRSETILRYIEVEVPLEVGSRRALVPMNLLRVVEGARPQVRVASITAAQFTTVPMLRNPDQVTLREEDMIVGYFGGGHLYAKPSRLGPLL
jgi:photosynthetic reaction center H subunit